MSCTAVNTTRGGERKGGGGGKRTFVSVCVCFLAVGFFGGGGGEGGLGVRYSISNTNMIFDGELTAAARCQRFEDQLILTVVRRRRAGRSGYIGDGF